MRLREAGLWLDPPEWYSVASPPAHGTTPAASLPTFISASTSAPSSSAAANAASAAAVAATVASPGAIGHSAIGHSEPAAGFVSYTPVLLAELLSVPRIVRGALPLHHLRLMHAQLEQLRDAFFVARALGRALVLPETQCSCELGFWPNHIEEGCTAGDHKMLVLPYTCPIDHYLDPRALNASRFAHRERTFLGNPRTPPALNAQRATIHVCAASDARCDVKAVGTLPTVGQPAGVAPVVGRKIWLPPSPSVAQLRASLGGEQARVLHFADVRGAVGTFESASEATAWHTEAQALLASWCCTSEPEFKRMAGRVPYLLPPHPAQAAYAGNPWMRWAAEALSRAFARVGDAATATAFNTTIRDGGPKYSKW